MASVCCIAGDVSMTVFSLEVSSTQVNGIEDQPSAISDPKPKI